MNSMQFTIPVLLGRKVHPFCFNEFRSPLELRLCFVGYSIGIVERKSWTESEREKERVSEQREQREERAMKLTVGELVSCTLAIEQLGR